MERDRIMDLTSKQRELVRAVFLNDVERTTRLISELDGEDRLMSDIGVLSVPFPLYYITLCNYKIWHDIDEWKDKAWAQSNKTKTLAMLRFWQGYSISPESEKINYSDYHYHILCDDPNRSDDDILSDPKIGYMEAGCREIDVDLFCAVMRFDFDKVKALLLDGANPNQDLYYKPKEEYDEFEEPDNILEWISTHCSYKESEYCYLLKKAQCGEEWVIGEQMIEYLLDIAACNDMYRLLTNCAKYDHLDKLKKALFYNNFERVKELIESPLFSEEWLVDCRDFDIIGEKSPIYYITQLWNELLPGDWGVTQNGVDRQKFELKKITDYLRDKFGIHADLPMDVARIKDIDSDYIGYQTIDDVWLADDDIKTRVRDIDMELYCAASRFDFVESERLLRLGADPMVLMEKADPDSSIYAEMSDDFLERDWWQTATLCPSPNYEKRKFKQMMIYAMIGSILKERMLNLFHRYTKINE